MGIRSISEIYGNTCISLSLERRLGATVWLHDFKFQSGFNVERSAHEHLDLTDQHPKPWRAHQGLIPVAKFIRWAERNLQLSL